MADDSLIDDMDEASFVRRNSPEQLPALIVDALDTLGCTDRQYEALAFYLGMLGGLTVAVIELSVSDGRLQLSIRDQTGRILKVARNEPGPAVVK